MLAVDSERQLDSPAYPTQRLIIYLPEGSSIIRLLALADQVGILGAAFEVLNIRFIHSLQYLNTLEVHIAIAQRRSDNSHGRA